MLTTINASRVPEHVSWVRPGMLLSVDRVSVTVLNNQVLNVIKRFPADTESIIKKLDEHETFAFHLTFLVLGTVIVPDASVRLRRVYIVGMSFCNQKMLGIGNDVRSPAGDILMIDVSLGSDPTGMDLVRKWTAFKEMALVENL